MAKKKFGKFVALATVSGVIAAGVSYFLKYKSFHDELDEDFHDFEKDDEFDGELPHEEETPNRTYVTLNEKKTAAVDAATATVEHAEDTAQKTVDAADALAEKAADTVAKGTADAIDKVAEKAEDTVDIVADKTDEIAGMVKDTVKDTAEAAKDAASKMTTIIEDDVL